MTNTTDFSAEKLLRMLQQRFHENPKRHENIDWETVEARLVSQPEKLASLAQMEETGGEPDVVSGILDDAPGEIVFVDCAEETPKGRLSLCYDEVALAGRKKNPPVGSAEGLAARMGVRLVTEAEYRALQALEPFDRKTSSWVATPEKIRQLGGALFCDRRYDTVFVYHNGADSYYASRGFRTILTV